MSNGCDRVTCALFAYCHLVVHYEAHISSSWIKFLAREDGNAWVGHALAVSDLATRSHSSLLTSYRCGSSSVLILLDVPELFLTTSHPLHPQDHDFGTVLLVESYIINPQKSPVLVSGPWHGRHLLCQAPSSILFFSLSRHSSADDREKSQ